jgi:hypothetical protein
VVVLELSPASPPTRAYRVAAVSVEVEYAGAYDVIVPLRRSPLGCSFMIECWNVREVLHDAIGEPIGSLGRTIAKKCLKVWKRKRSRQAPARVDPETGLLHVDRLGKRFQAREARAVRAALTPFR